MTNRHAARIAPLLLSTPLLCALPVQAQDITQPSSPENSQNAPATTSSPAEVAAPETAAPATENATPAENATPNATPAENTTPDVKIEVPVTPTPTLDEGKDEGKAGNTATTASRLTADSVRYEGGTIVAEGSAARPARFVSGAGEITAQSVRIDTVNRTLKASGGVVLQRTRLDRRRVMRSGNLPPRYERAQVTDTLRGGNLDFDFKTRQGHLDHATVQIAGFDLIVDDLTINGDRYIARNVVLRPGGQTPEEDKIYGIPPLSLRARQLVLTERPDRPPVASVRSAGLYFKKTRILPIPRGLFDLTRRFGGGREEKAFSLTPRLSLNSIDRVLVTTRLRLPLENQVKGLALVADVGLSAKQTFRGGLSLEHNSRFGQLALRGKVKDIVTQQIERNKFMLDRLPELAYESPDVRLFKIAGRQTGLRFNAGIGNFEERAIDRTSGLVGPEVRSARRTAGITLTTRMADEFGTNPGGAYVDLFAATSNYSRFDRNYRAAGFEIGYDGRLTNRLSGVFSYRHTHLRGDTPFLFDEVEIPRELRATFDFRLSPRYMVPIDLRYDLERDGLRNKSFGLLRSYKNFAYGLVYDSARRDLSLEFRSGF
jgi:hypothetical protein